jgi:hypothetical protein
MTGPDHDDLYCLTFDPKLDAPNPVPGRMYFDQDLHDGSFVVAVSAAKIIEHHVEDIDEVCNHCVYNFSGDCDRPYINCFGVVFQEREPTSNPGQPRVTPVLRTTLTNEILHRAAKIATEECLSQLEEQIKKRAALGFMTVDSRDLFATVETIAAYFKDSPISVRSTLGSILNFTWAVE